MKLATALLSRSDIQNRISELERRLNSNAKVQEGEKPAEDPMELIDALNGSFAELEDLIARINRTNNETVSEGKSISDLIAKRDCLKQRISIMRNFLLNASNTANRMTKTEIKILSTVPVAELQKDIDRLAKELRETDELIQSLNWTTELL